MSKAIKSEHVWVVAATVVLDAGLAAQAARRGTVRLAAKTKIEALETYCDQCRQNFEDVDPEEPCSASVSRDHLIGGPIGERKKRGPKMAVESREARAEAS